MNSNIGHKTMSVLLADLIIKTIYFNVSWTFIDRFIYSSKYRGYLMYSKSRGKKKISSILARDLKIMSF